MCPFASALTTGQICWRLANKSTGGRTSDAQGGLDSPYRDTGDPWCMGGAMGLALRTVVVEALGCSHGGGRRKRSVRKAPSPAWLR